MSGTNRSTRQQFIGAAIVAGGAVYLDPAAAAAATPMKATTPLTTTPVAKLIDVRGLPGEVTPHDLALLAGLEPSGLRQVASAYPDLRFGQLRNIIDAVIKTQGADAPVFKRSGTSFAIACCCCSCCCKFGSEKTNL